MKFKDIVLAGTALLVVYNAGKAAGRAECFNQFMNKYGDDILEKHGEIVSKVGKFIIKVSKAK